MVSTFKPLFFAIDNIDLQIYMPDGKNQLYGTAQVVLQQTADTGLSTSIQLEQRNKRKTSD